MAEPTTDDVDALVGPATPQFAFQIRARVHELVADLPEDDPVRAYAESKVELLERLGFRVDEGGELGARVARAHRLGDDPVVGARVGSARRTPSL